MGGVDNKKWGAMVQSQSKGKGSRGSFTVIIYREGKTRECSLVSCPREKHAKTREGKESDYSQVHSHQELGRHGILWVLYSGCCVFFVWVFFGFW